MYELLEHSLQELAVALNVVADGRLTESAAGDLLGEIGPHQDTYIHTMQPLLDQVGHEHHACATSCTRHLCTHVCKPREKDGRKGSEGLEESLFLATSFIEVNSLDQRHGDTIPGCVAANLGTQTTKKLMWKDKYKDICAFGGGHNVRVGHDVARQLYPWHVLCVLVILVDDIGQLAPLQEHRTWSNQAFLFAV